MAQKLKNHLRCWFLDHADPVGQHAVIQNTTSLLGPVGPEVKEPLALLVFDHADPAGQYAVIQNTTSLLEHLPGADWWKGSRTGN